MVYWFKADLQKMMNRAARAQTRFPALRHFRTSRMDLSSEIENVLLIQNAFSCHQPP